MNCRWVLMTILLATLVAGCDIMNSIILRPSNTTRMTPTDLGYKFEAKMVPMSDGTQLSIWHVKTTSAACKGIIVVVPGNDSNKSRYVIGLPLFIDDGWDMILMDYPGYGESTGTPTLEGLIEGAGAVVDYAATQSDTVVGYGISLGTTVLARIAADHAFKAIMFDGTLNLYEAATLFADHYNLGSPLTLGADAFVIATVPQDYDIKYWITQTSAPKLFLASPGDNVTPFAGAYAIYQAASDPKWLFAIQGDHVLQLFLDPGLYRDVVNGWLDGVLNQNPVLNAQFQQLLQGAVQQSLEQLGFPPEARPRR